MKKLKDFMYNVSDVLVAIIILGIATLLILWRMNTALSYPATIIENNSEVEIEVDTSLLPVDDESLWANGVIVKDITFTIPENATKEELSGILVNKKLFTDVDEFERTISALGKSVKKIESGEFTFKAGSTKEDIISLIVLD